MNTFNKIVTGLALSTVVAGSALAGTIGDTSTDNSVVTLEIADKVQITNVDNISLGAYSGAGAFTGETEYCVHRNGGDSYTVKLTSNTGAFHLTSATTTENINFALKVDADTDASDGQALTYNTASSGMSGSALVNCGGGDNGALEVSFTQADLLAVSSANDYTATLTVLIEPL